MQDGPIRRVIKGIMRAHFELNLRLARRLASRRGERPFRLGGECRRCARCCEDPTIQVGRLLWYSRVLGAAFLWWQEAVNGFVLVQQVRASRSLVFRCTHFDPETRSCDSYESRPGMCRDYPRQLLWQANPELFAECGYRAVAPNAERLLAILRKQPMSDEQREKLKKGLHLER